LETTLSHGSFRNFHSLFQNFQPMNNSHTPLQNPDIQGDRQPEVSSGSEDFASERSPESQTSGAKVQSRRADQFAHVRTHRNPTSRKSRGGSRLTAFQQSEKLVVWGCCVLGALVVFAAGFYFGQKFGRHADVAEQIVQQDAEFPLPETDALLDVAFTALRQGNYRDAMMNFQKAQDKQPALVGLDYLIAESSYKAGESVLAREAAGHALSKNESAEQARVLLAQMDLEKSQSPGAEPQQLADPNVSAETEIKQFVASHLADAKGYALWGDLLRGSGSYRSAADVLHKGVLRADPDSSRELLSAKEQLARLQNDPLKTAPSLSELTSMSAEQSLLAALTCFQQHQGEEAASFLERARDLYSPQDFRELMNDVAFVDYRDNPQAKRFFKQDQP